MNSSAKSKLTDLVELMHLRTGRLYKDSYLSLGISRHIFGNYFLRDGKTPNVYKPDLVFEFIEFFYKDVELEQRCTIFEALLIGAWSSTGFKLISRLKKLYMDKQLFEASLLIFSREFSDTYEYNTDEKIRIQNLIEKELNKEPASLHFMSLEPSKRINESLMNARQNSVSEENSDIRINLWRGSYWEVDSLINKELRNIHNENDKNTYIKLLQYRAIAQTNQAHYKVARKIFEKALELAPGSSLLSQITVNNAANEYYAGNLGLAKQYFEEGLKVALANDDANVIIYAQTGLASIAKQLGQLRTAQESYQKLYDDAQEYGLKERLGFAAMNLAHIYAQWEQVEQAKRFLLEAMQLSSDSGSLLLHLASLRVSSSLALTEKNFEASGNHLELLKSLADSTKAGTASHHACLDRGRLYLKAQEYQKAKAEFLQLLERLLIPEENMIFTTLTGIALSLCLENKALSPMQLRTELQKLLSLQQQEALSSFQFDHMKRSVLKHYFQREIFAEWDLDKMPIFEGLDYLLRYYKVR